jgi:hypothetical protein
MNKATEINRKAYSTIPKPKRDGIESMKIRTRYCTVASLLLTACILTVTAISASAEESNQHQLDYETGFYYTVQEGDTLWDLSQRFSDTPWQWPDLWHENKQLPNPHWIYPGERIRLFRKTDQHRVGETVVKEVPPVQPTVQVDPPAVKDPGPRIEYFFGNIDQVGFIRKPAVRPLGTVVKSFGDKRLISKGDTVYISYTDSNGAAFFAPGARMTLFRYLQPTDDRGSTSNIGTQHLLSGVIEVTKKEADYAIAKVVNHYSTIFLEDMVMPYEPKNPNIMVVDSTPGMSGRIISSENHNKLISDHHIAFIDKGMDDSVKPGQVYQIYNPVSHGRKMIEMERTYTGTFFVLHSEKATSTVVITHNIQKITPGDRLHTP